MKVIAEVGSNIKSYSDAEYSICKAREAGANYVKFQCYSEQDLYGTGSSTYEPFKPEWIKRLKEVADKTEIGFMCTGFSPGMYALINLYVDTHKVASAEITDLNILSTIATFKKPVVLSTGGASIPQIQTALEILKGCPVTIMYCVPKYPAKYIDFEMLPILKSTFGNDYSYGYSDHSIDIGIIPVIASQFPCTILEKHVNFLDYTDTPDCQHSLNFEELSMMIRVLKGEEISLADIDKLNNVEMATKHQRVLNIETGKYKRPKQKS